MPTDPGRPPVLQRTRRLPLPGRRCRLRHPVSECAPRRSGLGAAPVRRSRQVPPGGCQASTSVRGRRPDQRTPVRVRCLARRSGPEAQRRSGSRVPARCPSRALAQRWPGVRAALSQGARRGACAKGASWFGTPPMFAGRVKARSSIGAALAPSRTAQSEVDRHLHQDAYSPAMDACGSDQCLEHVAMNTSFPAGVSRSWLGDC